MPKKVENLVKEMVALADDVAKAAWIEFYLGHGDRSPDGTRLSPSGKQMIENALRTCALALRGGGRATKEDG